MSDERSFKPNTLSFEQAVENSSYAPLIKWVLEFHPGHEQWPAPQVRGSKVLSIAALAVPLVALAGLAAFGH